MKVQSLWSRRNQICVGVMWAACATALTVTSVEGREGTFRLVPEMEASAYLDAVPVPRSEVLNKSIQMLAGFDQLRQIVVSRWSEIQSVDLEDLSRYQLEATKNWRLPDAPGDLSGKVLSQARTVDQGQTRWYLQVEGPRLPAKYDIVHRHLVIIGRFDPGTGDLDQLIVTIQTEVFE